MIILYEHIHTFPAGCGFSNDVINTPTGPENSMPLIVITAKTVMILLKSLFFKTMLYEY